MKNTLIKSTVFAAGVIFSLNAFNVNAAGLITECTYKLIAGAPWADKYKMSTYSGHVQCPATAHDAIGGYNLYRQVHK